jgi:coatomer subunit beta'
VAPPSLVLTRTLSLPMAPCSVTAFEAHQDYIRSIAVHPNLPVIVSCGDDMVARLWNWESGGPNGTWQCTQIYEGHSHYVMQAVFNPKASI